MDPIALTFYALVCGILGAVAPNLGGAVTRLAIGAVVGVFAAGLLPVLRKMLGI